METGFYHFLSSLVLLVLDSDFINLDISPITLVLGTEPRVWHMLDKHSITPQRSPTPYLRQSHYMA